MNNTSTVGQSDVIGPNITVLESPQDLLSDAAYTIMGLYLTILGLTSAVINGMVITILMKGKPKFIKMHTALLLNLSVSDFAMSILAFPLSASSSYYGRWLYSDAGCTIYGFIVFSLAMGNMNTLVAITVTRYLVACKPQYDYLLSDTSKVKFALFLIWFFAVVWTGAPLFGWNSYVTEKYGTSCTINWYGGTFSDRTYIISILISCYLFHIAIFVYCYANIVRRQKNVEKNEISDSHRTDSESEKVVQIEKIVYYHKVSTSRKVTLTSFCMVITYVFTWTPYTIISMLAMAIDLPTWIHVFPTLLAKSSCLANPLVYGFLSTNFRTAMKTLLKGNRNRVHPVYEEERQGSSTSENRMRPRRIPLQTKRYKAHVATSNGIYIGKQEFNLPVETYSIM